MLFDNCTLICIERPFLQQDRIGHEDLAQIVK
jgi:hypothetical protein